VLITWRNVQRPLFGGLGNTLSDSRLGCIGRDPRTAWGLYALLEIVRFLPMVLTDLSLRGISKKYKKATQAGIFTMSLLIFQICLMKTVYDKKGVFFQRHSKSIIKPQTKVRSSFEDTPKNHNRKKVKHRYS